MNNIEFDNNAKKDFNKMKKNGSEAKKVKIIEEMIKFLEEHGADIFLAGRLHPGWRPEELKSSKRRLYSFRINKGDRLTFEILQDGTIKILGVKGHYSGVQFNKKFAGDIYLDVDKDAEILDIATILSMIDLFYAGILEYQDIISMSKHKHIKTIPILLEQLDNNNKNEIINLTDGIEYNNDIGGFILETDFYIIQYTLLDYMNNIIDEEKVINNDSSHSRKL